ncbi:hypothetical protein AB0J74_05500 [Asanoa sp. NPDC049573]|uniref:hypothetical protein n=1 Tax=Asanoa sp. NPDC049573 TaxID=3155396 RepID=UPI0034319E2D
MLEETLRRALRDRVELTPAGTDRAEAIIRRTRRGRRLRKVATTLGAVLAFVLLIGGVTGWQLLRTPRTGYDTSVFAADPTALPQPAITGAINAHDVASLGLDLRIGDLLWTTDGRRLDLGGFGAVDRAYRVPAGWLFGSTGGVYLQPVDGRAVQIAPEGSRWSVSEDGLRIAVVTGGKLSVAELSREGAKAGETVAVPPDAAPTAMLGSRVLLAGNTASERGYEFVTVDKNEGTTTPIWNPTVSGVFGVRSDAAVGLAWTADEEQLCLAALSPGGLGLSIKMTSVCGFEPPAEGLTHSLSPDGGWLAEPSGDQLDLVSVDTALVLEPSTAKKCAAAGVRSPIWIDSHTVVAAYDDGVVRCQTDGSRKVLSVPKAAGSGWDLVPRLGSTGG